MHTRGLVRKLSIAMAGAVLGSAIGAVGASAAARLLSSDPPGACRQTDTAFATADGGCKDLVSGRVWSRGSYDSAGHLSYSYFKGWCDTMTQGGYSDWRMPTVTELQTLASHESIANDTTVHLQTGMAHEFKWSGTNVTGKSTKYVYQVDLRDGSAVSTDTRTGLLAEGVCVR